MKKYIVKRVLIAVLTLFVITLALFVMEKAMPGSPFNDEKMTRAQLQILYAKYGLDKPVLIQFWDYLKHMLTGDFGVSYSVQVNT
ncbi:ABC transporter permease, partial [Lacticaseibacillus paracasei]|nr:ABC transporter permease [Lacticaseibacillus paracasei]